MANTAAISNIRDVSQKPRPFSDLLRIFGQFVAAISAKKIYQMAITGLYLVLSSYLLIFIICLYLLFARLFILSLRSSISFKRQLAVSSVASLIQIAREIKTKSKIIFYYFYLKISLRRPKTAQRQRREKKTTRIKRKRKQQPRKYKQLSVGITLGKVWECRTQRRSRREPTENPPNLRNHHRNSWRRNSLPTTRVSDCMLPDVGLELEER